MEDEREDDNETDRNIELSNREQVKNQNQQQPKVSQFKK